MTARERLLAEAAKRILITDGAFGTMIQNYSLDEVAYRGSYDTGFDQKGNNDLLVLTRDAGLREHLLRLAAAAGSAVAAPVEPAAALRGWAGAGLARHDSRGRAARGGRPRRGTHRG